MAVGFYVSVISGTRKGLAAGPYPTHQAALDDVDRVKAAVKERDSWAHFYAWGTARAEGATLPTGLQNALVGAVPQST